MPIDGCFCAKYFRYIANRLHQLYMKVIYILIYEDTVVSSVSGVVDLLKGANNLAKAKKKGKDAFRIELVGERSKKVRLSAEAQFVCSRTIADALEADIIIVPPFNITPETAMSKNKRIIHWLRTVNVKKTEVASLCYGSYFLAEAGLLAGREATSHWMAIDDMKKRYSGITLLPDSVITDYKGVYTSGGAFSSLNLILYLIEKFCGRDIAVAVSKEFSIDMDRTTQTYFAMFRGQRDHNDMQIQKAQTFIEKNYNKEISIGEVAVHVNMSKRNFIRRFKDATQTNPLEYLQRVKIESAKKIIEKGERDILAVMDGVGYNDLKTFRSLFRRFTGLTPQEYAKKYRG